LFAFLYAHSINMDIFRHVIKTFDWMFIIGGGLMAETCYLVNKHLLFSPPGLYSVHVEVLDILIIVTMIPAGLLLVACDSHNSRKIFKLITFLVFAFVYGLKSLTVTRHSSKIGFCDSCSYGDSWCFDFQRFYALGISSCLTFCVKGILPCLLGRPFSFFHASFGSPFVYDISSGVAHSFHGEDLDPTIVELVAQSSGVLRKDSSEVICTKSSKSDKQGTEQLHHGGLNRKLDILASLSMGASSSETTTDAAQVNSVQIGDLTREREELQKQLQDVETRFNALAREREQLQKQLQNVNTRFTALSEVNETRNTLTKL